MAENIFIIQIFYDFMTIKAYNDIKLSMQILNDINTKIDAFN